MHWKNWEFCCDNIVVTPTIKKQTNKTKQLTIRTSKNKRINKTVTDHNNKKKVKIKIRMKKIMMMLRWNKNPPLYSVDL